MADFVPALKRTLGLEDDPRHPGVVTPEPHGARARLGINSLAHPELPDAFWTCSYEDALEIAARIYRHDYWEPLKLDSILSQDLANKVFDMAVNMGVGTAARMFQRAAEVEVDGRVGPVTIATANSRDAQFLVSKLRILAETHYRDLVRRDPVEYGRWLDAWVERARS